MLSVEQRIMNSQISAGVSIDILMAQLAVQSNVGFEFELYTGTTIRYDQQYQLAFSGTIDQAQADLILVEMQTLWSTTLTGIIYSVSLSF